MFGFFIVRDTLITNHTYTIHFFVFWFQRHVTEKVAGPLSVGAFDYHLVKRLQVCRVEFRTLELAPIALVFGWENDAFSLVFNRIPTIREKRYILKPESRYDYWNKCFPVYFFSLFLPKTHHPIQETRILFLPDNASRSHIN